MRPKIFPTTDPKVHAYLRKRTASAYSMSTMLSLEPKIQEIADNTWERLREAAKTGQPIDLEEWTSFFAFDVVGTKGMGGPIGFVEHGRDFNGIIRSIHQFFRLAACIGYMPGQMEWFNHPATQSILQAMSASNPIGTFRDWIQNQVSARFASGPPKDRAPDMLDYFISMKEPNGEPATFTSVFLEGMNLIGAGADTVAIGMLTTMGQLLKHPEDYAKVRAEVDKSYQKHGFSDERGQGITYAIAEKLPYLNACVKEATLLCPSILWQLPREVPDEGVTIAGHYIPPSATVSVSPIAHNRSKDIFGEDADEWVPSRYLDRSPEYVREIERYNLLVSLREDKHLLRVFLTDILLVRLRVSLLYRAPSCLDRDCQVHSSICASVRCRGRQQRGSLRSEIAVVCAAQRLLRETTRKIGGFESVHVAVPFQKMHCNVVCYEIQTSRRILARGNSQHGG
jgi:cytochrome P450